MKHTDKFEKLLKQSAVVTGSAAIGTFAATAAFAAPIDSLVITDVNVTLNVGDSHLIDLDDDGQDDFFFQVNSGFGLKDGGQIEQGFMKTQGLGNAILSNGKFCVPFGVGEDVSQFSKADLSQAAVLYFDDFTSDFSQGPLGEIGATAFIGVALGLDIVDLTPRPRARVEALGDDEDGELGPHFGWIEVERGSLKILRTGFQTVANLSAPIPGAVPAVPLPATLPLLLAGAGGLMALRRRKAAA